MLRLRPPGLEFRILCLKGSVISFMSGSHQPQEILLVQFTLYVHTGRLTPHSFIHSFIHASSFPEISVVLLIREIIHTLITKLNMSMATSRHNLTWMKMYLPSRTWEKYRVMVGVFEIL